MPSCGCPFHDHRRCALDVHEIVAAIDWITGISTSRRFAIC